MRKLSVGRMQDRPRCCFMFSAVIWWFVISNMKMTLWCDIFFSNNDIRQGPVADWSREVPGNAVSIVFDVGWFPMLENISPTNYAGQIENRRYKGGLVWCVFVDETHGSSSPANLQFLPGDIGIAIACLVAWDLHRHIRLSRWSYWQKASSIACLTESKRWLHS